MSEHTNMNNAFKVVTQVLWPGVDQGGLTAAVRWPLHLLLLAPCLALLFGLNAHLDLPGWLPSVPRWLAHSWLPLQGALVYAMAWVVWYLWTVLSVDGEAAEVRDVADAWQAARQALARAGIDLRETPLFLVLGQPESGVGSLFHAAQRRWKVWMQPGDSSSPLHVCADDEGVYVTCSGVGLMGLHNAELNGAVVAPDLDAAMAQGAEHDTLTQTMWSHSVTGTHLRQYLPLLLGQGNRLPTPVARREARKLVRMRRPQTPFLARVRHAEWHDARLGFLCRLISAARSPRPPLNGILLVLPFAGLDRDQDAANTGDVLHHDLAVIQMATGLHCPRVALLADLESVPGFVEFAAQFPPERRRPRLGQGAPLRPDLSLWAQHLHPGQRLHAYFSSLCHWVCTEVVPGWVYSKFKLEKPGHLDCAGASAVNGREFQFLAECRERADRLALVLRRTVTEGKEDSWLAGLYLAGTGTAAAEQGWVPGVFELLLREQDRVAWTGKALQSDSRAHLLAHYTCALTALLIMLAASLLVLAVKLLLGLV